MGENNEIILPEVEGNLGGVDSGELRQNGATVQQIAATHLESGSSVSAATSAAPVLPLPSSSLALVGDGGSSAMKSQESKAGIGLVSGGNKPDGSHQNLSGAGGSAQGGGVISSVGETEAKAIGISTVLNSIPAHTLMMGSKGVGRGSGNDIEREDSDPNSHHNTTFGSEDEDFSGSGSEWMDNYQQQYYMGYFNQVSDGDSGDFPRGRGSSLERSGRSFGTTRGRGSFSVGVGRGFGTTRGSLPASGRADVFQGFGGRFWGLSQRAWFFLGGK
jgi:hypothetical protein